MMTLSASFNTFDDLTRPCRGRPAMHSRLGHPPVSVASALCSPNSSIAANQGVRGAVVVQYWLISIFKFWDNSLRQDLTQFHAPLIERIDVPDDPLRKDRMFVQPTCLPKTSGVFEGNRPSNTILAEKLTPVWHQPVSLPLRLYLIGRFPELKRLRLREYIGQRMS